MTKTRDLADLGGGFIQAGTGATQRTVEDKLKDVVSVKDFGAVGDGTTDDTAAIQAAVTAANGKTVYIPSGTFKVAATGITLPSNTTIKGDGPQSILQSTPITNTTVGSDHKVGNGNVFRSTGTSNVSLVNLTVAGIYDSAWGAQDPYTFTLTSEEGNKLVYFNNCSNVCLEQVTISKSFSSYLGSSYTTLYGFAPVGISNTSGVHLINCTWKDSAGEAWHVYLCNNVLVSGCNFTNDRYVSALDLTFCERISVVGNIFAKLLASDSGDLLNIVGRQVAVSNNVLKNGSIDVGNEYLAQDATYGVSDIIVDGNTIYNGFIQFASTTASFTGTYLVDNAKISDNSITIDLDTRPAANDTTVLNYSAITLPANKASRNISVEGNIIQFKGTLQSGNKSYNNYRPINCVHTSASDSIESLHIIDNKIFCNFNDFDLDLINDATGGGILLENGTFTDVIISNNTIRNGLGIRFKEATFNTVRIENNSVSALSFFSHPYTGQTYTCTNLTVRNNEFTFVEDSSYTYTNTQLEKFGVGAFMAVLPTNNFTLNSLVVADNRISCPIFMFVSNFNTTANCFVDLTCINNSVTFTKYTLGTILSNYRPIRVGRPNTANTNSACVFRNNTFTNNSTVSVNYHCEPVKYIELTDNSFRGDYAFTFKASSTVLSEDYNGIVIANNVSVGGTMTTSLLNLAGTTDRLIKNNSDQFDSFGTAITSTITGAY